MPSCGALYKTWGPRIKWRGVAISGKDVTSGVPLERDALGKRHNQTRLLATLSVVRPGKRHRSSSIIHISSQFLFWFVCCNSQPYTWSPSKETGQFKFLDALAWNSSFFLFFIHLFIFIFFFCFLSVFALQVENYLPRSIKKWTSWKTSAPTISKAVAHGGAI